MKSLTPEQIDILRELINIGVGRAAGMLNELLQAHVDLAVPYVRVLDLQELIKDLELLADKQLSTVQLSFKGPFSGVASLVFPPDSAGKLVDVLTGEEYGALSLDEIRIGTLTEVGNIVINGVMGSIGNVLEQQINYSIPTYIEGTLDKLIQTTQKVYDTYLLLAHTRFRIEAFRIEGDIIIFFEVGSFDALLAAIDDAHNHVVS